SLRRIVDAKSLFANIGRTERPRTGSGQHVRAPAECPRSGSLAWLGAGRYSFRRLQKNLNFPVTKKRGSYELRNA
ncbi:MAG: hypothetical protein ACRD82_14450, partial [Blastocatellia bacterium]